MTEIEKRKNRGHGEGTIRKRADGRWMAQLMVGYKPDGARDIRSVYGKTRGECQKKLDDLRRRRDEGLLGDPGAGKETVEAFLLRWLEAIQGTRRDSTLYRYRVLVHTHLIPAIGKLRLADLKPQHLVALYAQARKTGKRVKVKDEDRPSDSTPKRGRKARTREERTGLSPRTVKYLHTTLKLALDMAVKWGAVPRNVARAVDAPRVPKVRVQAMHPAEVSKLLTSSTEAGDRLGALWTVAVYSGAREGELLGLTWGDVDFDHGTMTIWRTLVGRHQDGSPRFNETKTDKGRRTLSLDADALEALRLHRDRQQWDRQRLGEGYKDYGLVFASEVGTPLNPSNVIHRFKRALRRAGLSESYSPHSLRHANATLQLASGVATKVASERLGHSTVQITQDLYQHVLRELDESAATKIGDVLRAERDKAV
jgi:integrase